MCRSAHYRGKVASKSTTWEGGYTAICLATAECSAIETVCGKQRTMGCLERQPPGWGRNEIRVPRPEVSSVALEAAQGSQIRIPYALYE
eukprot:2110795-Pleurochrysis_carterae.AAC.2